MSDVPAVTTRMVPFPRGGTRFSCAAIVRATGADARAYVAGLVGLRSVFPARFAEDPVLVDGLVASLEALRERGVREAVRAVLSR